MYSRGNFIEKKGEIGPLAGCLFFLLLLTNTFGNEDFKGASFGFKKKNNMKVNYLEPRICVFPSAVQYYALKAINGELSGKHSIFP